MINLSRWNLASYALMTAKETKGTNNDVSRQTPDAQTIRTPASSQTSPSASSSEAGSKACIPKSSA